MANKPEKAAGKESVPASAKAAVKPRAALTKAVAKSFTKTGRAAVKAPPTVKSTGVKQAAKRKTAAKSRGRLVRSAKFAVGQVVRHRIYPFRGVVFDIDPVFANTEEWLNAIPAEVRPRRNQPFYHLLAESAESEYIAYVSEQNLLADNSGEPVRHPQISEYFIVNDDGTLRAVMFQAH